MADDVEEGLCMKHDGPHEYSQNDCIMWAKLPAPTPVATPQTKGLCKWCSVPWCGETVNAVCPVRQPHGMPHVWENDHPVATGEAKLPLDAPTPQAASEGKAESVELPPLDLGGLEANEIPADLRERWMLTKSDNFQVCRWQNPRMGDAGVWIPVSDELQELIERVAQREHELLAALSRNAELEKNNEQLGNVGRQWVGLYTILEHSPLSARGLAGAAQRWVERAKTAETRLSQLEKENQKAAEIVKLLLTVVNRNDILIGHWTIEAGNWLDRNPSPPKEAL